MVRLQALRILLYLSIPVLIVMLCVANIATLYLTPFDRTYLNELYDHSQYSIAQSIRQIGDGHVYQVIGDRLVRDRPDIFSLDPQVPPLGKTLIGLSIALTGNGYSLNILTLLLTAYGLGLTMRLITGSSRFALGGMVLLLLDPLLVSQLKQTMLDLPLLTVFVYHTLFLILYWRAGKSVVLSTLILGMSGIVLGLASTVKFGILIPLYGGVGVIVIVLKYLMVQRASRDMSLTLRMLSHIVLYAGTVLGGFLLGHAQYFFAGGTLLQFLKNEKWVVTFWLTNNIHARIGMPLVSLMTGWYRHFTRNAPWEWITEWNPLWIPAGVLVFSRSAYVILKRDIPLLIVFAHFVIGFAPYLITPFYYRYMVTSVPFLAVTAFILFNRRFSATRIRSFLVCGAVILLTIKSIFVLYDQPNSALAQVEKHLESRTYQDLYSALDSHSLSGESRYAFWRRLYGALYAWQVSKVDIELQGAPLVSPFTTDIFTPYTVTYTTPIGRTTAHGSLRMRRVGHMWKLIWDDEYVWPGYNRTAQLSLERDTGVRNGSLLRSDGSVILSSTRTPLLVIQSDAIRDEGAVVRETTRLTGLNKFTIENAYKSNHPPDLAAPVGYILPRYHARVDSLSLPAGVFVRYEDVYPIVPVSYASIVPQIGGRLIMSTPDRREIIYSLPSRDGIDIISHE